MDHQDGDDLLVQCTISLAKSIPAIILEMQRCKQKDRPLQDYAAEFDKFREQLIKASDHDCTTGTSTFDNLCAINFVQNANGRIRNQLIRHNFETLQAAKTAAENILQGNAWAKDSNGCKGKSNDAPQKKSEFVEMPIVNLNKCRLYAGGRLLTFLIRTGYRFSYIGRSFVKTFLKLDQKVEMKEILTAPFRLSHYTVLELKYKDAKFVQDFFVIDDIDADYDAVLGGDFMQVYGHKADFGGKILTLYAEPTSPPLNYRNIEAKDFEPNDIPQTCQGVLGIEFLKNFSMVFDKETNKVVLEPNSTPTEQPVRFHVQDFHDSKTHPSLSKKKNRNNKKK